MRNSVATSAAQSPQALRDPGGTCAPSCLRDAHREVQLLDADIAFVIAGSFLSSSTAGAASLESPVFRTSGRPPLGLLVDEGFLMARPGC